MEKEKIDEKKYFSELDKELDPFYDISLNHEKIINDFMTKLDLFMNLKRESEFDRRNEWIIVKGLKIYIRRSHRGYQVHYRKESVKCLDLASIEVDVTGTGLFTKLLKIILEKYDNIFVESILDKRFYNFLLKFGFEKIEHESDNLIRVKKLSANLI